MKDLSPLEVPPWVFDWLSGPFDDSSRDLVPWDTTDLGWRIRRLRGPALDLISIRVPNAVDLDAPSFESVCHGVYLRLLMEVGRRQDRHPIRWWNLIPHILQPLGTFEHRYMAFNSGRYRALSETCRRGGPEAPHPDPATASGVGHHGRDLMVHCLAADRRGASVENPRQIPAYRYSARYGPLPPCFARATRLPANVPDAETSAEPEKAPWLLVGGTASVLGEKSAHVGNLDRQLEETLANLAAVARVGLGERSATGPDGALRTYRHLRVYFVDPGDREILQRRLRRRLPEARVEMLRADLCRPDLLVEIEGIARADRPTTVTREVAADFLAVAGE